jgi:hypothetical protein
MAALAIDLQIEELNDKQTRKVLGYALQQYFTTANCKNCSMSRSCEFHGYARACAETMIKHALDGRADDGHKSED